MQAQRKYANAVFFRTFPNLIEYHQYTLDDENDVGFLSDLQIMLT